MGNCWGGPVDNHSPSTPKTPSLETCRINSIKQNGSSSKSGENNSKTIVDSEADTISSGKIITPNLKKFSLNELKNATKNFRSHTVLSEGSSGIVYKGYVRDKTYAPSKFGVGIAVAIKKFIPQTDLDFMEWQNERELLGKFSHPNIIKLLGYCTEGRKYHHVYEYMPKGSLENHLFRRDIDTLPWSIRLKIAIGAARALDFLHTLEKPVIYWNFKTSHILLDGLATLGQEDDSTRLPGHLSVKSDVYGFGVVFLEILMGLRAFDKNRPREMLHLVVWAKPSLSNKRKLEKIMDPRLKDQYPPQGAYQAAQLVLKCLESNASKRPSMEEVLETLEQIDQCY